MNSEYTVYFDGYFSHAVRVSAQNEDAAEQQAHDHLDEILPVDDFHVDFISINQPSTNYISLKSFYTKEPPQEEPQSYTSLNDFYTSTSYTPLYN